MDPDAQWTIDAAAFPAEGSALDKWRFLIGFAILAPSGHNTQPWLFRVAGDRLHLIADRRRALRVVDPHDRALIISNGAALALLLVAIRHYGFAGEVQLLPDPADPDLLASVALGAPRRPDDRDQARFAAIPRRRTTRTDFAPDPLPADLAAAIAGLSLGDARIHLFSDAAARRPIAALVADGDRAQFADPAFRRELAAWVRSRRASSRDGMSGANFGMPDRLSAIGALVIRHVDMGARIGATDRQRAEQAPALALVTTRADRPLDWLHAGMIHADMLLDIAAAGFTAAYLNQPVEVAALRPRLAQAAGVDALPQLLLRLGKGPDTPPAVRRGVDRLLLG